jgi:AcrR family transcriptional regulator
VSPLREQQAELTRELILRALVEQLERDGAEEITVPALARRSGVSPRTVYRYFPTRDDLLAAGADWIYARTFGDVPPEETIDDLPRNARVLAKRWEAHPRLARAVAQSSVGGVIRRHRRSQRLAAIRRAVDAAAPCLPERERREAAALLGYLHSLRLWVALRDDLGLSESEAAETVEWALTTLIEDLRRRSRSASRKARATIGTTSGRARAGRKRGASQ